MYVQISANSRPVLKYVPVTVMPTRSLGAAFAQPRRNAAGFSAGLFEPVSCDAAASGVYVPAATSRTLERWSLTACSTCMPYCAA